MRYVTVDVWFLVCMVLTAMAIGAGFHRWLSGGLKTRVYGRWDLPINRIMIVCGTAGDAMIWARFKGQEVGGVLVNKGSLDTCPEQGHEFRVVSVSNGTRMVEDLGSSRTDTALDSMMMRDSSEPILI